MTSLPTPMTRPRTGRLDLHTGRATHSRVRTAGRAVAIIAAALIAVPIVAVAVGYHPAIVAAPSASPGIDKGDIVLNKVVPPADVQVGDIITYLPAPGSAKVTGVVAQATATTGTYSFRLEGTPTDTPAWSPAAEQSVTRGALRLAFLDRLLRHLSPYAADNPDLTLGIGVASILFIGGVWMALATQESEPEYW